MAIAKTETWERQAERDAGERDRIVRLCRRITGQAEVAEDLAQETLAEAWQLRDRVTDVTGYDRWLTAIARHICARWMRAQVREAARRIDTSMDIPEPAGEWDLAMELERAELETLLDRALASLAPETSCGNATSFCSSASR